MIITFFRSSSYNTYYYCPQKYFLTYVLGYQDEPNKKTELGTITHKVFECLAALKKAFQETGKYEYEDEAIGKVFFSKASLYDWTTLTDEEVDKVNKSRINKEVYLENCRIDYGHKRMGVKAVEVLIKKAWDYYTPKSKNEFQGIDYLHVRNFVWMTLDRCNGMYDPRNRDIFQPEQNFSFEIDKPWASYHYLIGDKEIKGNLGIKGTIDLITKVDDETLEIIDWKTGKRYDWGAGEEKTYEKLCEDPQLMLYYYAARKLFPQFKTIIFTIFFCRHGGPFTIIFDDENIAKMEANLQKTFEEIKKDMRPKLLDYKHMDFRCNRLCTFFKTKVEGQSLCSYIMKETAKIGMDKVVEKHTVPGFTIGKYNAPGE